MLRIATVFSGIGAPEESLKQLGIPHVIKFACDNGEREPKQKLSTIFEVASSALSEAKAEKLINKLITIIFSRKFTGQNMTSKGYIKELVLEEYAALRDMTLAQKVKYVDRMSNYEINYYGVKYSFKIKLNDLSDAAFSKDKNGNPILTEKDIAKFVKAWYDTTKTPNYVKLSYMANYQIENDAWYEDVRFLDGTKYTDQVDLFVGGSPCQSFSTYGKKRGLDDARGTLFYDYARLVSQIRPRVFIYENVKGLLTHDKKRTWMTIKRIFESLDYKIHFQVLNAQDYGLPQKRERIFVVGIRKDIYQGYNFPEPIPLNKYASEYLDRDVPDKYYLGKKGFEWVTNPLKNHNKTRFNREIIGCQTANQQDNWIGDLRVEPALQRHIDNPKIHKEVFNGVLSVARKMTPGECLRLMGFENFKVILDDKRMYRQAGNSIAVPVLKELIYSLKEYLPLDT